MKIDPAAAKALLLGVPRRVDIGAVFDEMFGDEFPLFGDPDPDMGDSSGASSDSPPPLADRSVSSADSSSAGSSDIEGFLGDVILVEFNTPLDEDSAEEYWDDGDLTGGEEYRDLHLPGACGSIDAVHVKWNCCPAGDFNHYKGKKSFPSVAFECVIDNRRRVLGISPHSVRKK